MTTRPPSTDRAMRAARLHGVGDIRLHDEAIPTPHEGESLLRVTVAGLCGSDLHWFGDGGIGDSRLDSPLVLGHEFAAVVEDGPGRGRRVAVDPAVPCGSCDPCRAGHHNLCTRIGFAGHGGVDGALRGYLAWRSDLVHEVPDTLTDADAAMLEPLGVAIHAMDLARQRVGSTVAVVGCGPIGLMVVQLARAAGARQVVAVEPLPHRRDAALRLGADVALDPAEVDDETLREATLGHGADVVFEVAGTDSGVDLALLAARPAARVLLVGIPDRDTTTFTASLARRKGLTLVMVRRMKDPYPRAIALVEQGRVDVRSVVTDTYPLERVQEAFARAAGRSGLKVVVETT